MFDEQMQQAFRWGKLAFEIHGEGSSLNGTGMDSLALDAFEKCSLCMVTTASKLLQRFVPTFSLVSLVPMAEH